MKSFTIFTFTVIAGLLMTPWAHAQATTSKCPANINPLQLLVGTWTFSTQGFGPTSTQPFSSAGQFVARIGTDGRGSLTITNTASRNGQITRLETDAGTYQLLPDCSGGTLTFNLSTGPLQFDFWFSSSGLEFAAIRPFCSCPLPLLPEDCPYAIRANGSIPGQTINLFGDRSCGGQPPCDREHNCIICACPACVPSTLGTCASTGPMTTTPPLFCPVGSTPGCSPGNDITMGSPPVLTSCGVCGSDSKTNLTSAVCTLSGRP
jgi:hypothetical protein